MELTTSVLCLFLAPFFTYFTWKYCYSGLLYRVRWVAVYLTLCWRNATAERPAIPIFASKKEEYLEKPRVWTKEKRFRRDSMLVFATGQDVWLLLEVARGRHNSAAARVHLQLGSSTPVYHTSEQDGRPRACDGWTTDSIALQCLEPMRRWRILFTGRLYSRNENEKKCSKLVKINLIWAALNGPYHYQTDAHVSALTDSLAEHPLSHVRLNLESLGRGYEQWGTVQGTVCVDGSVANIHALSLRRHAWLSPHLTLVGIADNGALFSISYTFAGIRSQLGHVRYSDGRVEVVTGTSVVNSPDVSHKFVRTFTSSCYSHLVYVVRSQFQLWGGQAWAAARGSFDSHQARCLILSWNKSMKEDLPLLPLLEWWTAVASDLVLSLDHSACGNPAVVGGKAASLALLSDVAHTILKNKVVVPAGFCLTVNAMQLQVQSSQHLASAVQLLSLISSGQEPGNLQEQCHQMVSAWLSVPMCGEVVAVLTAQVCAGRSYAVRSSARGEDSALTSAAGQNATVLGCVGVDAVIAAVHKCWASLYTFRSVQYRRQAGLPVEELMAVVVQEMVAADSAGVMFTRHPVTADPCQLLITANYGLGETVVSGDEEPDTIVVNTATPGHLVVDSSVRGHKEKKLSVTDEGSVMVEAVDSELAGSICLSEPQIIALAQVGVALEKLFGWPRDIEWAIGKGVIYMLQCRPVTSLHSWSHDEMTHELDSAILPGDVTTTANLGEVLPGATSPLCQSTVLRGLDFDMIPVFAGVQDRMWYNNSKVSTSHHHAHLHLLNTLLREAKQEPSLQQRVLELAVCGHRVSTPEIQEEAAARTTPLTLTQTLHSALFMIMQIFVSKSSTKKAEKLGKEIKLSLDSFTSSAALYAYLTASYAHMLEVFRLHTRASLASTLWQTILFSLLAEDNQELTEENLQDIAQLLVGAQTAVSAQIPTDIQKLIKVIKSCKDWSDVALQPPEKLPHWLDVNCPPAASMLADIIHRYQHRNNKELDVMTRTWGLDNSPLLAMIQTTLRSSEGDSPTRLERQPPGTHLVDHPSSLKKPFIRWVIGWLAGLSGTAAGRREVTKDAILRVVHQLRLGYLQLAQLLCAEGRLPHSSLIWMFTHYELGQIICSPQPALLHKVSHRERSWRQWDQLQFQEVMTGLPIPVDLDSHTNVSWAECVTGTLVCGGRVRARACVLHSCVDSGRLRAGDVLITHSTDVGWSPLFPLLAGIVTELGGLISHGAVVAREYGLPCVVGATNATLVFKTGDEVYLDGLSGKVVKISSSGESTR